MCVDLSSETSVWETLKQATGTILSHGLEIVDGDDIPEEERLPLVTRMARGHV